MLSADPTFRLIGQEQTDFLSDIILKNGSNLCDFTLQGQNLLGCIRIQHFWRAS